MITKGLLWVLLGGLTAYVCLVFQRWSVSRINPQNQSRSVKLVIGGAILRWLLVFAILAFSLSHSYRAMLIVFVSFMAARLLILFRWNGQLRIKSLLSLQS